MIELIKDIIKQHYPMILTCGLMFLVGVGIGGAISDALNRWTRKGERSNEEKVHKVRSDTENTGFKRPDKTGERG